MFTPRSDGRWHCPVADCTAVYATQPELALVMEGDPVSVPFTNNVIEVMSSSVTRTLQTPRQSLPPLVRIQRDRSR